MLALVIIGTVALWAIVAIWGNRGEWPAEKAEKDDSEDWF